MKKQLLFAGLLAVSLCGFVGAQSAPKTALVPLPASMEVYTQAQAFELKADTVIAADAAFLKDAQYAARELNRATGFSLKAILGNEGGMVFRKVSGLGPEAYRLTVSDKGVLIEATEAAGAFYGFQTFRQLLPAAIFDKAVQKDVRWLAAAVKIADEPRLRWRGMMMDDCRRFFGLKNAKDLIDTMAAHKMNVFHWHLTEDQGWRIEIKKYPQLVLNGARRDSTPIHGKGGQTSDGKPYGWYYYTQDQVRELVAYAAERHITVVPELEMPGHSLALLSSFPELSCTGGPFKPRCVWGVEPDILCAGNDAVYDMLKDILDELMALFPSKYIHCGGDEAPKARWKACPKCQKRMRELGLKNEHQLQSWFMQYFAQYLESKGRHLIGWDEILEGGLPKGAAIMSWLGTQGGIKAAKAGHEAIMTPYHSVYLDYGQNIPGDPYPYMGGGVSLQRVYAFNPTAGVPEQYHKFIIGTQGNIWTECIEKIPELQYKAWPRGAAIAEVAWTPQALRTWEDFSERIVTDRERIVRMGNTAAPLPEKPTASWKKGEVPTVWTARTWDVSRAVKNAGTYEVTFRYTGGASRLEMRSAELLINGTPVAKDVHDGFTGTYTANNVYKLTLKQLPAGAKAELRANVRADGNSDSAGAITVNVAR